MNCPVYTFGPQAHPAAALSLKDALAETFPNFKFDIEMMSTSHGFREAVVIPAPCSSRIFENMVTFSRGFVAGFGSGTPPTKVEAQQRAATRIDCPVARRKSDPPPASAPTLPSQKAPVLSRRPTLVGVPVPSLRLATNS
jgi:hypothetical protein